jgi:hypothetical protein
LNGSWAEMKPSSLCEKEICDNKVPMKEKLLLAVACLAGVSAVAYGMARKDDLVFAIGILIVIGSYLAIRRKLKAALRDKTSN